MTEQENTSAPPATTRPRRRPGSKVVIAVASGAAGLLIGGLGGAVIFGENHDHVRAAPASDTSQPPGGFSVKHASSCGQIESHAQQRDVESDGERASGGDPHHGAPSPNPSPPA